MALAVEVSEQDGFSETQVLLLGFEYEKQTVGVGFSKENVVGLYIILGIRRKNGRCIF